MSCMRSVVLTLCSMTMCGASWAQEPPPVAPKPPGYSLPWLLRSITPASLLRIDETLASSGGPSPSLSARTAVTSVTATYKASPHWVPVFRLSWVSQDVSAGNTAPSGSAFSNPLIGTNYVRPLSGYWRASGFIASTIPVGSGGGDRPNPRAAAAIAAAPSTRSGMDNALFAVNYWTVIAGGGLARVTPTLSVQAEITLLQLTRARGPETQDPHRTNLTAGFHVGHFLTPRVSIGAEARMQRWLTSAAPVLNDPAARTQFTFAAGPRLHLKVGDRWLRPGISYGRAIDAPMSTRRYGIVQFDLPLAF